MFCCSFFLLIKDMHHTQGMHENAEIIIISTHQRHPPHTGSLIEYQVLNALFDLVSTGSSTLCPLVDPPIRGTIIAIRTGHTHKNLQYIFQYCHEAYLVLISTLPRNSALWARQAPHRSGYPIAHPDIGYAGTRH